nr:hypothetical protein CFP56_24834 [Quercus suber]
MSSIEVFIDLPTVNRNDMLYSAGFLWIERKNCEMREKYVVRARLHALMQSCFNLSYSYCDLNKGSIGVCTPILNLSLEVELSLNFKGR